MEFWLQKGNEKLQLPVKPSDFTVNVASKNTVVNVIRKGDINLKGNTGLRDISLSSFFPAKDYNFSNNSIRKKPLAYVNTIEVWRTSAEPIRVIITGTLNMECYIESFSYGMKDATGDIYYTLSLKEHKAVKATRATVSIATVSLATAETSTRAVSTASENVGSGRTYKIQSGDSLWKIAKQFYGNGDEYTRIYNANKAKISNPNALTIGTVITIPEYSGSAKATATATKIAVNKGEGNKNNPPYSIVNERNERVKSNFLTWSEANTYFNTNGGKSKGWKIVDGGTKVLAV